MPITLFGLRELKDALRNLPVELRDDAQSIVESHADAAAAAVVAAYPIGPPRFFKKLAYHYPGGELRKGVKVEKKAGSPFGTIVRVRSTSKHAWLYENGSELRHTEAGINRGRMPAGKAMIPIVIRERRAMYDDLAAMIARHGLTVSRG